MRFKMEPLEDQLVMVLTLDKRKMRERVMIGSENSVKAVLEGGQYASLVYDRERPLGQFLLDHEEQVFGDWNLYGFSELADALRPGVKRKEHEEKGKAYLKGKSQSLNTVDVYIAYKSWPYYSENATKFGSEDKARDFVGKTMELIKSFKCKVLVLKQNHSMDELLKKVQSYMSINNYVEDAKLTVWYPWRACSTECVVIEQSLLPAIVYYLQRLRDWGFCYCYCKVCGKWFLAPNKHCSLCSDACKTIKNRKNKQSHDTVAKTKREERDYKNCYQRMNGRFKEYCASGVEQEKMEAARNFFSEFRREANKRKKKIESDQELREYQNWLFAKEQEFGKYLE